MTSLSSDLFAIFQTDSPQQVSLPEFTANRIKEMINSRKLLPGARLPNELELADAMGVSRGTMRTALNILQEQGLIWRRQGIGSFVSEQPILENRLDINSGVTELIESMGLTPGTKILEIKQVAADVHQAGQLNLPIGSQLVFIRRIRMANTRPVVSSIDIFPYEILKQGTGLMELEKFKMLLEKGHSIYRLFESEFSLSIDYGITRLRPVKVNARQMRHIGLGLPAGSVLLYMEQLDYDRNRRPIYFSSEYHVADFCTFTIFRRR
ncbi:MAG TPA: GntR family transcriptional regulator [Anaerolineales bacterium]